MIEAATLAQVLGAVACRSNADYQTLAGHLRASFPGIHITVCGEDDVPVRLRAAAGNDVCGLYYVNASEHCLSLTDDAEAATGLVVALCDADQETA